MRVSEEQLIAFVDGELTAEDSAAISAAIAGEPELARRVAAQRALAKGLRRTFDPTLAEVVPRRLIDAARGTVTPTASDAGGGRRNRRFTVSVWLAAAASLLVAVLLLPPLLQRFAVEPDLVTAGPNHVAGGKLARALSRRLAGEPAAGGVQVGLSFLAKSGDYCRTFTIAGDGGSMAGLACRQGNTWSVPVLEPIEAPIGALGSYRQAASTLPARLLQAVQARLAGEPLDAAGEAKARASGWRRPDSL
jgi:hypothetical protein